MKNLIKTWHIGLVLILAALFGQGVSSAIEAAASESRETTCYNVADADARTYCLARARGERSVCYSIQRPDLRSLCLAEARK